MTCRGLSFFFHVFLILHWSILFVAAQPSDPRCEGYTCPTVDSYDVGRVPDPSACNNGTNCPTCLTGAEWESILTEVGAGTVKRTFEPWVVYDNWLSATILETVFTILLKEVMGFSPVPVSANINGFGILCCEKPHIKLEVWPSTAMPDDEGIFSLAKLPVGFEGASGLFVPAHTLTKFPLATSYQAYRYLDDYKHIFPPSGWLPCLNMTQDREKGCTDGNYVCDENVWEHAECTGPYYVPPQCKNNPDCQEAYLASPLWDQGFFEGLIKNSGLNFTVAYAGSSSHVSNVKRWTKEGRDFMFYWWEPDPLVSLVQGKSVNFKPASFECEQKRASDPGISESDCGYPKSSILKYIRRSALSEDSDFKQLFESFQISAAEINNMLAHHESGGGTKNVYQISCDWIKNNYLTWKDWAKNTKVATAESSSDPTLAIALGVIIPLLLAAAAIGGVLFLLRRQGLASIKNAPTEPPLVLMFTDVESSTNLWEMHGKDMAAAMEIHHDTIRQVIDEYDCYEVKTIGDSFMVACPTIIDATLVAIGIQRRLYETDWPEPLRYWKAPQDTDGGAWHGLRVRIGVHYCTEIEPKLDTIHQRYDYYGHDVNVSARVESLAKGGMILMTSDTFQKLKEDPEFFDMVEEDIVYNQCSAGEELKGVSEKVALFSIVPRELASRKFEPFPGADNMVFSVNGSQHPSDHQSVASSAVDGGSASGKVLKEVFAAIPAKKDKEVLLAALIKRLKLSEVAGSFARKLKAIEHHFASHEGGHQLNADHRMLDKSGRGSIGGSMHPQRRRSAAPLPPPAPPPAATTDGENIL